MRVALVIGHTYDSKGASNANGVAEYDYNSIIVNQIKMLLPSYIDCSVVHRGNYSDLPGKINKLNPDLILSFHCNAFNKKVSGTEVLHYHTSIIGAMMAVKLQRGIVKVLGLTDRGIKAKRIEDRGGYLLAKTWAPCLIVEPFFIDNTSDLQTAFFHEQELILAYVEFIINESKRVDNINGYI